MLKMGNNLKNCNEAKSTGLDRMKIGYYVLLITNY